MSKYTTGGKKKNGKENKNSKRTQIRRARKSKEKPQVFTGIFPGSVGI